jgi:hypothetical protein
MANDQHHTGARQRCVADSVNNRGGARGSRAHLLTVYLGVEPQIRNPPLRTRQDRLGADDVNPPEDEYIPDLSFAYPSAQTARRRNRYSSESALPFLIGIRMRDL